MAYIGREPQVGNFQVCDAISVVNGQAAYTMQVNSVNVSPETANHMLVSLNGVLQAPGSSYTVSGSTITFASNLVTGDVINFIHILGSVLDLGVPSNDTVGAAQIKDDLISGTTALTSEPADTDEFLVSDAGTLKRIDYSLIKGGGAFTLLSTTNVTSAVAQVDITSNIDSTYKNYMFVLTDVKSVNDDTRFKIQFFSSSGSPDTGSVYMFAGSGYRSDSANLNTSSAGDTEGEISLAACSVDAGHRHNQFVCYLFNPSGTDSYKQMSSQVQQTVANNRVASGVVGTTYMRTVAVTGVRFKMGGGNITRGTFKLYGIS
jgi:hypothetical protein